jgi:hypothetical protein
MMRKPACREKNKMTSNRKFVGVCLTGDRRKLVFAFLDPGLGGLSVEHLEESDALPRLVAYPEMTVAIAGPLQKGKAAHGSRAATIPSRHGALRAADVELSRRGIVARPAPPVESDAPGWMRMGFQLAKRLRAAGYCEGPGGREDERWLIETHPVGCFAALIRRLPLPRDTLEGRLQRQLALYQERLALPDPMDVLEEITAHHLLAGDLPLQGLYMPEELEALAGAYTAWAATLRPERVSWLGGEDDSWICLPAESLELKYRSGSGRLPLRERQAPPGRIRQGNS